MRRILVALMALTAVAVVSCTKEKSFEEDNGNSSGNSDGELLTQIVFNMGPSSATTAFSYDANKRLVSETNQGGIGLSSNDSLTRITRNAQGIIEKVELFHNPLLSEPSVWYVRYDAAAKRYIARLTKDSNGNVEDSVAYSYNALGKIVSETGYVDFGGGFEATTKDTVIYDGTGNIKKVVLSEWDGSTWEAGSEKSMEYDVKINPLKLAEEAIVLNRYEYFGNNNVTKVTIVDYDMPTLSQEITLTYTYNASDKPLTAAIGLPMAGGATLPASFKYK